jgi:hypothetical protein
MLDLSGGFDFIGFDQVEYTRRIEIVMGQIIREAARDWIRAIIKSVPSRNGFPVLTGAARSTLVPLGRFLRNVPVTVNPVPGQPDRRKEGEDSSSFKIVTSETEYLFEWSTTLDHYRINDQYPVIKSAPWHTMDAGADAFVESANRKMRERLPHIADYVSIVRSR